MSVLVTLATGWGVQMFYVLLAKAFDPVVLILGLVGGRLSRSWVYAVIVAVVIAVVGETILNNGYETLPVSLVVAALWTSLGFILRKRKPKIVTDKSAPVARQAPMNVFSQMALGNHLTKMTNWMEAIENTRHTRPIGAGGGVDSLPRDQQARMTRDFEAGMAALSKYPRHVITAELIKNRQVALQFGRHLRAEAQVHLLDHLIERGVALGGDDFLKSYA